MADSYLSSLPFLNEVRGDRFLYLYDGNRASCFLQNMSVSTRLHILEDEILKELRNCLTDGQQHILYLVLL